MKTEWEEIRCTDPLLHEYMKPKEGNKCKVCGKTIDEIWKEYREKKKKQRNEKEIAMNRYI